jgi:hypothetical protein
MKELEKNVSFERDVADLRRLSQMKYLGSRITTSVLLLASLASCNCSKRSALPAPLAGKSSMEGVVLEDSDGRAVSGAVVLLCRDAMMYVGCTQQLGETNTDANGRYSFRDIPPGEYVVAVRESEQALFLMQKQALRKNLPEPVKYSVSAGEAFALPDIRLNQKPDSLGEPSIKLVYPVASQSISDPHPTLEWEPIAGAQYFVALRRVDQKEFSDVMLTDHPFQPIENNSITVPQDLSDGLYSWIVYAYSSNDKEHSVGDRKATAYFTVATAPERYRTDRRTK